MPKIIFLDNLKAAQQCARVRGKGKLIVLNQLPQVNLIRAALEGAKGYQVIDKKDICRKNYPDLRSDYIDFIGRLNVKNASLFWWAFFLTSKNPINSTLFYDLSNLLVLKRVLTDQFDCLVVVTNRRRIVRQMKKNGLLRDFLVRDFIAKQSNGLRAWPILTPIFLVLKSLRLIIFKAFILFCAVFKDNRLKKNTGYAALRSIVNEKSFSVDGFYRDTYFGELIDFYHQQQLPFIILASLSGSNFKILAKIRKLKGRLNIFVEEYWLSWLQVFQVLFLSLRSFFRPERIKGNTIIHEIDVKQLIDHAARADVISTAIFSHLQSYFSMRSLAAQVKLSKLTYPMENRPWERMIIQALRPLQPDCRIVGYQHASIGPKHMNFAFIEQEAGITPIPDQVITVGQQTREVLINSSKLRAEQVDLGCALRQSQRERMTKARPEVISNILIVLATNIEEYFETLLFLEQAFCKSDNFKLKIRAHPTVSISPVLKYISNRGFKFQLENNSSIKQVLAWSDLVIYVSSTVSLEALNLGIPVIYLDLDPFLNRDPLHNLGTLKWTAEQPEDIIEIVKAIEQTNTDDFAKKQTAALNYVLSYLNPTSEECLKKFI
ncbi:hypothetical protein ACFL2I_00800 [Candidatus Omnitrophota bacterium]